MAGPRQAIEALLLAFVGRAMPRVFELFDQAREPSSDSSVP
jgi:hypothetical protein